MAREIRPAFENAEKYLVTRDFVFNGIQFNAGDADCFVPDIIECSERRLRQLYDHRQIGLWPDKDADGRFAKALKTIKSLAFPKGPAKEEEKKGDEGTGQTITPPVNEAPAAAAVAVVEEKPVAVVAEPAAVAETEKAAVVEPA